MERLRERERERGKRESNQIRKRVFILFASAAAQKRYSVFLSVFASVTLLVGEAKE
jgi:hypothetical protein